MIVGLSLVTTACAFFLLGDSHARRDASFHRGEYEAEVDSLRAEIRDQLARLRLPEPNSAATADQVTPHEARPATMADYPDRTKIVAEIKEELQNEMGLLPVQLLRDRQSSFVELYVTDNAGETTYGTAGYLGSGYFITVKHVVVAVKDDEHQSGRKVASIKVIYRGKDVVANLVDAGDADVPVHSGDWAIIRTRPVDIPALRADASFAYEFAEPIFRLGNDYSKGIILSTGYVGQRTKNGLVTCLTDGHPGVSGGGVLDRQGDLVGISIGRMQSDFRFSFILPLRAEMFRKVPHLRHRAGS